MLNSNIDQDMADARLLVAATRVYALQGIWWFPDCWFRLRWWPRSLGDGGFPVCWFRPRESPRAWGCRFAVVGLRAAVGLPLPSGCRSAVVGLRAAVGLPIGLFGLPMSAFWALNLHVKTNCNKWQPWPLNKISYSRLNQND